MVPISMGMLMLVRPHVPSLEKESELELVEVI
jgi:hypothetical protein